MSTLLKSNGPYYRTYCPFLDGQYSEGGRASYVQHPKFAQTPERYIRAFLLLQKDLLNLFDYIEPADINEYCFSYRIHSLLLRTCIEIEANCKAILKENNYPNNSKRWDMNDYKKIEKTHCLSLYKIALPHWTGENKIRQPFLQWKDDKTLPWFAAYNDTKHDRYSKFNNANFGYLIDAFSGLLILLSAQFGTEDFSTGTSCLALSNANLTIGGYFNVIFPKDFPINLRYNFDWSTLNNNTNPFQVHNYNET